MHLFYTALEQGLRQLPPPPADEGTVALVVARPHTEARVTPARCRLTPEGGVEGDRWAQRAAALAGSPRVTEAFKAIGLQQAMLVIPVLSLALALVLWLGSRSIVRDMAQRA